MLKMDRKELPKSLTPKDFTYVGRPSRDQGDTGAEVGIADMVCVDQFGDTNTAKYYHAGVVRSPDGRFWVYLEWGRMTGTQSWNGTFAGGDYQFVQCSGEQEARAFFAKQVKSKNLDRLIQSSVGGVKFWAAKPGKDGYLIQDLATRTRGLPDAYTLSPVAKPVTAATKTYPKYLSPVYDFAAALVGGVHTFTRSLAQASGVTPTLETIESVRNTYIPAALARLADVGPDISAQVADPGLQQLTKVVAAIVPRPIPRSGMDPSQFVLSSNNIQILQQDLDAFESSLRSTPVTTTTTTVDPAQTLGCTKIDWVDPNGPNGWLYASFSSMTGNKHGYLSRPLKIRNIFAVERQDRDNLFDLNVAKVAASRQGRFDLRAKFQPATRPDLDAKTAELYRQANVIVGIHGTRPVNFAPILQTNFRLPQSLPKAQIAGANFGHGVYFATDWKKSYGYTGRGHWGHNGGDVQGRGCLMFLCDMIMGDAYRAPSTGAWTQAPNGKDSVYGVGGDRGHGLENDEHVIFKPEYQKIRYVVEFDWLT